MVDGYWNLADSLDDSVGFPSYFRIEGYWSVEVLQGNGKTILLGESRGISSEESLVVGAATVSDFEIEPGDSSSIALCLPTEIYSSP